MKRDLQRLQNQVFDILVLGGGVSGASIAWDAALRGFSVALIERKDFGHATSAATSKLIHGGLRYLAQGDIPVVRESLRERRYLEMNMAHQVFPLPFLMPFYDFTPTPRWMLGVGLTLYDLLSWDRNYIDDPDKHIDRKRWLSREKALQLEPGLNPQGLKGAYHYYDALNRHPNRSNLEYVLSAASRGAQVANYVACDEFIIEETSAGKRVSGVIAKDTLTGRQFPVRAKVTVNATGPWGDIVLGKLHGAAEHKLVRSKGIHLLFPRFHKNTTVALETRDKHHIFLIPWGNYSLLGTTDTEFKGDPDDLNVTRDDAQDFLDLFNSYFPQKKTLGDVVNSYAGLRPLVAESSVTSTYKASRRHEIVLHRKQDNVDGLVSVFGGKWTTSRALAEQTVDLIEKKFGFPRRHSISHKTPVVGGQVGTRLATFIAEAHARWDKVYSPQLINHLIEIYGALYERVLDYVIRDKSLLMPIENEYPFIRAEIHYAVDREMALTLADFLNRRCGLGNMGYISDSALSSVATVMGDLLRWDSTRRREEIAAFKKSRSIIG
ncbi:MAG TPA: glycerol-3-phosphate dehydrogenase/oxidase [Turneriella sp.]|nr:glycerol-3-phosphate dehydrogenase/oxidase [Turneriella sp.]HNM99145.1 glycerol-3-phosphate dehydrogenase/oxidase [Turneriella sp.]